MKKIIASFLLFVPCLSIAVTTPPIVPINNDDGSLGLSTRTFHQAFIGTMTVNQLYATKIRGDGSLITGIIFPAESDPIASPLIAALTVDTTSISAGLSSHESLTGSAHGGIASLAQLTSTASALSDHQALTVTAHGGIASSAQLSSTAAALSLHEALTTSAHGGLVTPAQLTSTAAALSDHQALTTSAHGGIASSAQLTSTATALSDHQALLGTAHGGVIPSSATGNYLLRVATATYLATAPGTCSAGDFITGLAADGTKTCGTPAPGGITALTGGVTASGSGSVVATVSSATYWNNAASSASTAVGWGNHANLYLTNPATFTIFTNTDVIRSSATGTYPLSITGSAASATGNAGTVTNGAYVNAANAFTGQNTMTNATYPVFEAIRTSAQTGTLRNSFAVSHRTSGDMVDGFASGFSFDLEDATSGDLPVASISAIRAGEDNTADIAFSPYTSGSGNERMRITSAGRIGVGINSNAPDSTLQVTGVMHSTAVVIGTNVILPGSVISAIGNYGLYGQTNIQNTLATGAMGYVITGDNGTDTSHYLEIGKNGSNYSDTTFGQAVSVSSSGYIMTVEDPIAIVANSMGTNPNSYVVIKATSTMGLGTIYVNPSSVLIGMSAIPAGENYYTLHSSGAVAFYATSTIATDTAFAIHHPNLTDVFKVNPYGAVYESTTTIIGTMTVTGDIGINGNNVISGSSWTATSYLSGSTANTYTDIPGVGFTVVAGSTYTWSAYAVITTTNTAVGYGFSVNGPATSQLTYYVAGELTTTTQGVAFGTAYGFPTTAFATTVVAGNWARMEGTICPSASGTVALRVSPETSVANVTVKSARVEWVKW